MNNAIKVCYLDDDHDLLLVDYLQNKYQDTFSEIKVNPSDKYDSLLSKIKKSKCDVLIIDSILYKNATRASSKLTGEQLELLLMNEIPSILTIIISQNDDVEKYNYIKKYSTRKNKITYEEYYDRHLNTIIDFYVKKSSRMKDANDKEIKNNDDLDEYTKELIDCNINKLPRYDLRKQDIDDLINKFRKIEEYVNK